MFKLNKIIAHNFCQLAHVEFDIQDTMTGLTGPNGSGKSSMLNAICGLLTGDFSRHPDGLSGCIRQGSSDGCYVEGYGEVNGSPFKLRRDITAKSCTHKLWLNNSKTTTYNRSGDIEKWFNSVTGFSSSFVSEFIFVKQHDLCDILTGTYADRANRFSYLFGTMHLTKKREKLSALLAEDKAKTDAAKRGIIFLTERVNTIEQEVDEVTNDRNAIIAGVSRLNESKINRVLAALDVFGDLIKSISNSFTSITQYTALIDESNRSYTDNKKICDELSDRVIAGKEQLDLNRRGVDLYKDYLTVYRTYDKCSMELGCKPSLPDNFSQDHAQLMSDISELKSTINAELLKISKSKDKLTLVDSSGIVTNTDDPCPVCGASPEHWDMSKDRFIKQISESEEVIKELTGKLEIATEKLKSLNSVNNKYIMAVKEYDRRFSTIASTRDQLDRIRARLKELNLDGLDSIIDNSETSVESISEFVTKVENEFEEENRIYQRYTTAQSVMKVATEHLENTKEILDKVKDKTDSDISELFKQCCVVLPRESGLVTILHVQFDGLNPDMFNTLNDIAASHALARTKVSSDLSKLTQANLKIAALDGELEAYHKELDAFTIRLQNTIEAMGDDSKLDKWYASVETSIDWLRKEGIPNIIHSHKLKSIIGSVNEILGMFSRPFTVGVNDDLTFTAYFIDGRASNSKALSGGEMVQLGIALRYAISMEVATSIGLMMFDEPTDGLDAENNECLLDIIYRWRDFASKRNQRVVIITHNLELTPAFDYVYRLSAGALTLL